MSTAPAPAINDDPRPKCVSRRSHDAAHGPRRAKAFVDEALAQLDILLDDQDAWIANHTKEVRELVRKHQAAQEAKSARKCVSLLCSFERRHPCGHAVRRDRYGQSIALG